ncbi:DUF7660 family protein [Bradyrhizobium sp. HKCCYLS2038]|uniref:DUF7660 family protein n=1 Tax=unclassified Bradyrhizobium TaxID=2631580 RepID=UPI003EC06209
MIYDLMSAADAVIDEQGFIRLLRLMALDRQDEQQKELATPSSPYGTGANGWENSYLTDFLEAAAAWAEATQHASHVESAPSDIWRRAAQIVVAGAFYE